MLVVVVATGTAAVAETPVTRYLIVVHGARMISSWSDPIILAPLALSTPTTLKLTFMRRISLPMGDSSMKSILTIVLPITQTLLQLRTSRSVKALPCAISLQSRTSRKDGVVPKRLPGCQFRLL